jgi:hypothetical protein
MQPSREWVDVPGGDGGPPRSSRQDPATIAWNLSTTSFYKIGGKLLSRSRSSESFESGDQGRGGRPRAGDEGRDVAHQAELKRGGIVRRPAGHATLRDLVGEILTGGHHVPRAAAVKFYI